MKELVGHYDQYALSVSATTRSPREGEVDGREYLFRTKEEFEQMIAEDALIEHACYVGNYYGTPKAYVEEQLSKGKDVIQMCIRDRPWSSLPLRSYTTQPGSHRCQWGWSR